MITIKLVSDLHFEFMSDHGVQFATELPNKDVDILILAGDITTLEAGYAGVYRFCERFPRVLLVPGNHEYYGSKPANVEHIMGDLQSVHLNLEVLMNERTVIDGIGFCGTTLWFPEYPDNYHYEKLMNDFFEIKTPRTWFYEQHKMAVDFLENKIQPNDIVITHHLPTQECIDEQYWGSQLNRFFASKLNDLIERKKPQLWCHGHSHSSMDIYLTPDTRIVRNPRGYEGFEINPNFNPDLIIKVQ